jgi:LEA14-like dessication related protein
MLLKPRWALLPLVAALALTLAMAPGCVTKPVVTVHHAEVRGLSTFGLNVVIFLQIRNDNAYDVQIRNVRCNVTFGRGYTLGPIEFAPNQWLPSNQTTLVPVPVAIPWQLIPALISETAGAFAVPYYVKGVADVTATRAFGIERNNYPIDEGGAVPRQMMVDAAQRALPIPISF